MIILIIVFKDDSQFPQRQTNNVVFFLSQQSAVPSGKTSPRETYLASKSFWAKWIPLVIKHTIYLCIYKILLQNRKKKMFRHFIMHCAQ